MLMQLSPRKVLSTQMKSGLLLAVVACASAAGCLFQEDEETTVTTWHDDASGITFSVTLRTYLIKNHSSLTVSRPNDNARTICLDDDVQLYVVRLLRTGDWLLVLNGEFALGGYHYTADRLVGEHHWEELPFTVWKGGGTVVAEVKVGQTDQAGTPAEFPLINERPQEGTTRPQ